MSSFAWSSSIAAPRTFVFWKWRTAWRVADLRDSVGQVKDDISLSSFKIVATERRLTSGFSIGHSRRCSRRATSTRLMNEVEPFVSITRTYLQMVVQRVACRCLYWRSLEGHSVEDTRARGNERYDLLTRSKYWLFALGFRWLGLQITTSEFKLNSG